MKKQLIAVFLLIAFVCVPLCSGCTNSKVIADPTTTIYLEAPTTQHEEPSTGNAEIAEDPLSHVPEEFKSIVANDLLHNVTAFDGRLMKQEICSRDEERGTVVWQIRMMDLYGKELAACTYTVDDIYWINGFTATEDGGFVFVLGFLTLANGQNVWESGKELVSRVIKCDREGNVEFDTPIKEVEGDALGKCFEKNGRYYFFGTINETREIASVTDVHMAVLDKDGTVLRTKRISGSDFDNLQVVEVTEAGFLLSIHSQSKDGDFAGTDSTEPSREWVFTVNEDLEIIEKKRMSGRSVIDPRIGEKDGVPVYRSEVRKAELVEGTPMLFVDYGDFFLIVSSRITGEIDRAPASSSFPVYDTETAYTAFDYNGDILFSATVPSDTEPEANDG